MLMKVSNKKNVGLKTLCYSLLIGLGLLDTVVVVFAADAQPAKRSSNDVIPVTRVNPKYPVRALEEKKVGWVTLEFTLDESGSVLNPQVVENCVRPAAEKEGNCVADDLFDEVSLAALKEWKYTPAMEKGVAVKKEHIRTMLKYQLND